MLTILCSEFGPFRQATTAFGNKILSIFLDEAEKITLEMSAAGNANMSTTAVLPTDRWTHLAFDVNRSQDNSPNYRVP